MDKEIIEGNKIISLFMRPENKKKGLTDEAYGLLEYHSSWDWLMPVYIKFKNLDIKDVSFRGQHKQVCASFGNGILSGDINNAFNDAVMAIKWYNQNKQH